MRAAHRALPWLLLIVVFAGYAVSIRQLGARDATSPQAELMVTLPLAAQVLFAGGDRHLAANLAGFRVLVASTARMGSDDYKVQARLQQDIAWLNPAHEDNYYIAAALLPWSNQVEAAQEVLLHAAGVRQQDWMPWFYYGFGRYYFYKDPAGGAQALQEAALHARDEQDVLSLRILALKWAERGYSTSLAAGVVDAMAKTSPPGAFKKYVEKRALRLKTLAQLRDAAKIYEQRYRSPLTSLSELVHAGVILRLPEDPLGQGYAVDADGMPIFKDTK